MVNNKQVLITGASSGIGAACAKYFAKAGANLVLCARRLSELDTLAAELRQQYKISVHTFLLDVCDQAKVFSSIASLPVSMQQIDILINNAGLAAGLDFIQEGNVDDWDAMIDTNIKGLLYVTRAILPGMVTRQSGHIINIGSVAAHEVYPKGNVYCASKHAVKALSAGLRMDLAGTNIRVSLIDPGAVETNFSITRFKGDIDRAASVYKGMKPLTPDDIADVILYCANCPPHVNISDVIIMPTDQACATMMVRRTE